MILPYISIGRLYNKMAAVQTDYFTSLNGIILTRYDVNENARFHLHLNMRECVRKSIHVKVTKINM